MPQAKRAALWGGGWQDQVGGLTAGIKLASTKPGLLQEIEVEHLKMPREAIEPAENRRRQRRRSSGLPEDPGSLKRFGQYTYWYFLRPGASTAGSVGRITVDLIHALETEGGEGLAAFGRREAPQGVRAYKFGTNLDMLQQS